MDIYVTGTLTQDPARGCPLTTECTMRKEGCGTLSQFVEKKSGLLSVPGTIPKELYPYPTFLVKIQFLKQIALIVERAR